MFLKVTVSISCFWRYVPFYMVFTGKCVFQCVQHMKYVNLNFNMSMCFVCHHEVTWPNCLGLFGDVHQFMFGIWVCVYIYNTHIYIYWSYIYICVSVVLFGIFWYSLDSHGMAWMTIPNIPCFDGTYVFFEVTYWTFGCNQFWVCLNNLCTLW